MIGKLRTLEDASEIIIEWNAIYCMTWYTSKIVRAAYLVMINRYSGNQQVFDTVVASFHTVFSVGENPCGP